MVKGSNWLNWSNWSLYRLGINAYDNSFLSDVIKKLSVNLYRFKHLRMLDTPIDSGTEGLENYIGQREF